MSSNWMAVWQLAHQIYDCDQCDAAFLQPATSKTVICPLCGGEKFTRLSMDGNTLLLHTPELIVPFLDEDGRLIQALTQFRRSTLLPPSDLQVTHLKNRLQQVYFPMWLVDSHVQARWQAEAGFDYEAVSYGEQYIDNGWRSFEEKERRIRWEPRVGELRRMYHNVPAPALEEHHDIERLLGKYKLERQQPYEPHVVVNAQIRLPTRSPQDAWSDAQLAFQNTAGQECKEAAQAQHIRNFKWSPHYENKHWTHILLPMRVTYYLDDAGEKQMVYIQGQSGRVVGQRRASMKLALRISFIMVALAILIGGFTAVSLFLAEGLVNSELGGLLMFITLCLLFGAVAPLLIVLYVNKIKFANEGTMVAKSLMQSAQRYWQE